MRQESRNNRGQINLFNLSFYIYNDDTNPTTTLPSNALVERLYRTALVDKWWLYAETDLGLPTNISKCFSFSVQTTCYIGIHSFIHSGNFYSAP